MKSIFRESWRVIEPIPERTRFFAVCGVGCGEMRDVICATRRSPISHPIDRQPTTRTCPYTHSQHGVNTLWNIPWTSTTHLKETVHRTLSKERQMSLYSQHIRCIAKRTMEGNIPIVVSVPGLPTGSHLAMEMGSSDTGSHDDSWCWSQITHSRILYPRFPARIF